MNLKEKYGQKYRVTLDVSWHHEKDTESRKEAWRYHEIVGKHGTVFPYGWNLPAVYFISNIVANRFNDRGWKILQNGEDDRTVLISVDAVDEILKAIVPRRKRQITEEMRERGRKAYQKNLAGTKKDGLSDTKQGVEGT